MPVSRGRGRPGPPRPRSPPFVDRGVDLPESLAWSSRSANDYTNSDTCDDQRFLAALPCQLDTLKAVHCAELPARQSAHSIASHLLGTSRKRRCTHVTETARAAPT